MSPRALIQMTSNSLSVILNHEDKNLSPPLYLLCMALWLILRFHHKTGSPFSAIIHCPILPKFVTHVKGPAMNMSESTHCAATTCAERWPRSSLFAPFTFYGFCSLKCFEHLCFIGNYKPSCVAINNQSSSWPSEHRQDDKTLPQLEKLAAEGG